MLQLLYVKTQGPTTAVAKSGNHAVEPWRNGELITVSLWTQPSNTHRFHGFHGSSLGQTSRSLEELQNIAASLSRGLDKQEPSLVRM
jgi:hypothetical protein